jgi:hypothetical protein
MHTPAIVFLVLFLLLAVYVAYRVAYPKPRPDDTQPVIPPEPEPFTPLADLLAKEPFENEQALRPPETQLPAPDHSTRHTNRRVVPDRRVKKEKR